jgi:hypothetical protein
MMPLGIEEYHMVSPSLSDGTTIMILQNLDELDAL